MKNLVVVDFDGTLLPYDSLRKLLFSLLWKYPFEIGLLLVKRRLRLISAAVMKHRVILLLEKKQDSEKFLRHFVELIFSDCSAALLEKIKQWQSQHYEVLVLSASPHIYLQYLQEKLDCKIQGSYVLENGELLHLYGKHKLNFIEAHFPRIHYKYVYAVADHQSDLVLLQEFETFDLIATGAYA